MLKVRNLSVAYGRIQAVRDVSIEVGQGQVVAILGANGAGKSSLLGAIGGLTPVAHGSVLLEGRELAGLAAENISRSGIALVPEGRRVFPDLTVAENLLIGGAAIRGRREREARREAICARLPLLAERASSSAGHLSGGQQQMLAIGRALMSSPRVLLLDEPSLGLAPIIVTEIFKLVEELRDEGVTVLLVEQSAHQALAIADYAYVLRQGQVVMAGKADEITRSMDLRSAYLGYDEETS